MSPLRVFQLLSNPYMSLVRWTAPQQLSSVDATFLLFERVHRQTIEDFRLEILGNHSFFKAVNQRFVKKRNRRVKFDEWHEFLYLVIRCQRPTVLFETGVFDGLSSAVILQALCDNKKGKLVSIDLPAIKTIPFSTNRMPFTTLPVDCKPGWVIPDALRGRHQLVLGESRKLLPGLLQEHSKIDVFFHDSLHTFEHQYFEYSTAWPYLSEGGILLSDDIFANGAFNAFSKKNSRNYVLVSYGLGALRK